MGLFRAGLAESEADKAVQKSLVDAVRAARKAQALCVVAARKGQRRGREHARKIQHAISLLESVGLISSAHDTEDPDLMPEGLKTPRQSQPPGGE